MTWLDTPKGEALWRTDARQRGCYCADKRKPCPYHEGYEDGVEAAARALMTDAPCDTCGGEGWVVPDGERAIALCPAGCDGGIRRAPLVPRAEVNERDEWWRDLLGGIKTLIEAHLDPVIGLIVPDVSDGDRLRQVLRELDALPGLASEWKSENHRLNDALDAARSEVDALRAALERIANYDVGSASDRRDIARRALLSAQKDDDR